MPEQNQKFAITVGTWPLAPGTYDPALDGAKIPDGVVIYGLFDENYTMYAAPESIPGLTRVDSIGELTDNTYFVLNTSSGFEYVLVKSDIIAGLMVSMVERIPDVDCVFQSSHEEFSFLGKYYADKVEGHLDFGKIFDDFFKTGGYDKINPHEKNKAECCVDTLLHGRNGEFADVRIGKIVDNVIEAPDGYVLEKFPAGEFLVVTSVWKPTEHEAHHALDINEKIKIAQFQNGLVVEDNTYPCRCIEKMFESPEKGHRWERWYPIKKAD